MGMALVIIFFVIVYIARQDAKARFQAEREAFLLAEPEIQPEIGPETPHRIGIACPTCRSQSVEYTSMGARVVSGVMGGFLFSKKARSQFHCLNCNYWW